MDEKQKNNETNKKIINDIIEIIEFFKGLLEKEEFKGLNGDVNALIIGCGYHDESSDELLFDLSRIPGLYEDHHFDILLYNIIESFCECQHNNYIINHENPLINVLSADIYDNIMSFLRIPKPHELNLAVTNSLIYLIRDNQNLNDNEVIEDPFNIPNFEFLVRSLKEQFCTKTPTGNCSNTNNTSRGGAKRRKTRKTRKNRSKSSKK
jgi:hypothetical protein